MRINKKRDWVIPDSYRETNKGWFEWKKAYETCKNYDREHVFSL